MRCLLAASIGLSLGIVLTTPADTAIGQRKITTLLILIGLSGTCLIGFSRYVYAALQTYQVINFEILFAFYKAKPPFVIGAALALPLCFILIIRSINQQMSRWWLLPSLLVICLSLFVAYFSNTKNGMIIFSICLVTFIINLVFKVQWNWRKLLLAIVIFPIVLSVSFISIEKHIQKNEAWPSLIADFMIGLDIDNQNHWRDRKIHPPPLNEFGKMVDLSTYERTAWFTAGIRLLAENPMGYGLLHHSFGVLALAKWPDFYKPNGKLKGATHSGWLDLALGLGIPGLLLVLIPLGASWYRSLQQQGLWLSYAAWTIPIMSLACLTTEVAGEHFTEVLFFMTAFFCGLTLKPSK